MCWLNKFCLRLHGDVSCARIPTGLLKGASIYFTVASFIIKSIRNPTVLQHITGPDTWHHSRGRLGMGGNVKKTLAFQKCKEWTNRGTDGPTWQGVESRVHDWIYNYGCPSRVLVVRGFEKAGHWKKRPHTDRPSDQHRYMDHTRN